MKTQKNLKERKDKEITKVVFRKYKDGNIIALFPYIDEGNNNCGCYMRVGQHGAAYYKYVIKGTKPAKSDEYKSLKEELESMGYNLQVIKRAKI